MRTLSVLSILVAGAWLAACSNARTTPTAASSASGQACTGCHGGAQSAAPPRTTRGATATTDVGVGAHAAHLEPGPFGTPVACSECHPVPTVASDPSHADGAVDVVFGPVASAEGARPTWDRATATCAGTYCHGATLSGGTHRAPVWNKVVRDASDPRSEVYCDGCHAIPPEPATRHPALDTKTPGYAGQPDPATPATLAVCATCHPDTVRADGRIDVEGGHHIDGVLQLGGNACVRCHGDPADATRPVALRPAPPSGRHGERSTADRAVGAHAVHLQGTDLTSIPVVCSECHAVPTSMRNHPNPAYSDTNRVVDLSWGPLATAGGAAPAWSAASLTCDGTYCHGSTLAGGTATAPLWTRVDGSQRACTSCHGMPPPTPAHAQDPTANPTPTDCNRCHAGYSLTTVVKETHIDGLVNVADPDGSPAGATCTGCHGDASRSPAFLRPAPPTALNRSTSPSVRGVGAHLAHLTGNHLSAQPVACGECHPSHTRTDHAAQNGYGLRMQFGALASTGRSYPRYDEQRLTCTATYCHGSTLAGGSHTEPVWNEVTGDPSSPASQVACGGCHGTPPPAPHVANVDCGTCHTGYTLTTVNLARHIDGVVDVSGDSCTTCHGDPSRRPATVAAAPPAEARLAGGQAPWAGDGASGAHLKHLVAGPLGRATPCDECHRVPATAPKGGGDTHGDGLATVAFGALARTAGAQPTFLPGTVTCSGTYCHGATLRGGRLTAPVWTRTDGSQVACGTCHAVPPADAAHDVVASGVSCGDCHRGYGGTKGGAVGAFTVNTALHVNGVVDATGGGCTSCHGTAGRRLVAGADAQAAAAPPADAKGLAGAGAHLAHLNRQAGAIARPTACAECHAVPGAPPKGAGDTHGDGRSTVAFGALARADGASPTFDAVGGSCRNTYCHGATLGGGSNKAPVWTATGATQAGCGTCHGLPPPSPHPASASCGTCHAGYTGTTVNASTHVDGQVQSSGTSCTSCHGSASRSPAAIAPAPPAEAANPAGGTAPWAGDGASGSHLDHLVAGALGPAIACSECHAVPTTAPRGGADAHGDGRATVTFGTLARKGGATPSFVAASLTCNGTYCHGATLQGGTARSPTWTRRDGTYVACGACHGAPPADTTHAALAAGSACRGCHTGYGGSKGGASSAFTVNRSLHLNGTVDATGGTCTSCHGTEGRALVTGADSRSASAPPVDAAGLNGTGAHLAHLTKGAGAVGKHVACNECHVVPSSAPRGAGDSHGDRSPTVVFGGLSRTGGASPSFSGGTCSATYCHGGRSVRWDAGAMTCTSCHANPPNDSCHTFRHEASGGRCNGCHRNTNASGTTIANIAQHVDGVIQGKCTDCHRDENMVCR